MSDVSCSRCRFYEERTHFCRLAPPIPIVFTNEDSYGNGNERSQNVSSKFPVIVHPEIDYCSQFKPVGAGLILEG
jgi:hypothetical protein